MGDQSLEIQKFCHYVRHTLRGYEKGEAEIFFDRLMQAFGNPGVREAGAQCEEFIKKNKAHRFADFVWSDRALMELKKRGENLAKHYDQLFDLWCVRLPRTRYAVLCNFDEFWIYDFNQQLYDPIEKIKTENLPQKHEALGFLYPQYQEPVFNNNNVDITKQMAQEVGLIYKSLLTRGEDHAASQRFVLQLVVALFAEDVGLVPRLTLQKILKQDIDTQPHQQNYIVKDELNSLFKSMSTNKVYDKHKAYKNIDYFNGGLFKEVEALGLSFYEWEQLYKASQQDWSQVRPSIFGSIFESSVEKDIRHGHGIHYTSELDIQKIVGPTLINPFKEQLKTAQTKKDLQSILTKVQNFKVLDPACGSGNFLYVAFRELRKLEAHIVELLGKNETKPRFLVSARNFYGIDINAFGLELAKVALSIGRKLSSGERGLVDSALPFDDLDDNFMAQDALFITWPSVDAIIGNPPFLGAKKIRVRLDHEYVEKLRQRFPEHSAMVDYCVYWFYKSHCHLKPGQRAGLVGTNTIRETNSRAGSLEYIVQNEGTIFNAVASQVWSGEANVHVSIVNWIKGPCEGPKVLALQKGSKVNSPWDVKRVHSITSSLRSGVSASGAYKLKTNSTQCTADSPSAVLHLSTAVTKKYYFQGQVTGTKKFYISKKQAQQFLQHSQNKDVVWPVLGGQQLLKQITYSDDKFVIDFGQRDLLQAASYKEPFEYAKAHIMPFVKKQADDKKGVPIERERHLSTWWRLRRPRFEMTQALKGQSQYIALSRTVKKPLIFEFVSSGVRPADALQVFVFEDYYSFGILQSSFHSLWAEVRGGSMGEGVRYTADEVFLSFAWPQNASKQSVQHVEEAARHLIDIRNRIRVENRWGLRELYKTLELEGHSPLKTAHQELDRAVAEAYGAKDVWGKEGEDSGSEFKDKVLEFLLQLNKDVYKREQEGLSTTSPGQPQ